MKPIIKVLDSVHCQANSEARELIKECLAYKAQVWRRGRFGRSQQTILQHLITGRIGSSGLFYTGLLTRVKNFCWAKKIDIEIQGHEEKIRPTNKPLLEGITFREDQLRVLRTIRYKNRGNIIFPTGSGKTIIALGIMSMFPNCRILFLCHTKALIEQTKTEMENCDFRNIHIIGAGYSTDWEKLKRKNRAIVLSTIQSFSKLDPAEYGDYFDITIIDEVHHVNSKGSQYVKAMENNLSPRRYGFTATIPTKRGEELINEGIIGPTIGELTISKGIEIGIIARPRIKLIPVPYDPEINQKGGKRYSDFYQYGIIENKIRNGLIFNEVRKGLEHNKSSLIIIERIEHGKILMELFRKQKIKADFVRQEMDRKEQEEIKTALKKKEKMVVICSKIWKEGINIPSLNQVIIAFGMKEEKGVLQSIGRGLRTTDEKKTVKLIDFLDPYRYLAEHAILRIQVYASQGWLK